MTCFNSMRADQHADNLAYLDALDDAIDALLDERWLQLQAQQMTVFWVNGRAVHVDMFDYEDEEVFYQRCREMAKQEVMQCRMEKE